MCITEPKSIEPALKVRANVYILTKEEGGTGRPLRHMGQIGYQLKVIYFIVVCEIRVLAREAFETGNQLVKVYYSDFLADFDRTRRDKHAYVGHFSSRAFFELWVFEFWPTHFLDITYSRGRKMLKNVIKIIENFIIY